MSTDRDAIRAALAGDLTVDIVTTGARSGRPRTVEIWFMNIAGRIVITGTPARRDWLANLRVNPDFVFRLKESVQVDLTARAAPVLDPDDRRAVMTAPQTQWYREQVESVDELVAGSPMVDVVFTGDYAWLNGDA